MESTHYQAVVTDLKDPFLKEVEKAPLKENEVRVKVMAVPVNPSDYYMTLGAYGIRERY